MTPPVALGLPVALHTAGAVLRCDRRAVVLVDGRSGSGKTTFGTALAAAAGARLLRLDDVYPGWDGLDAAARALVDLVLLPRRQGVAGRLRTWDWRAGGCAQELVVPVDGPLVVEGCGALSRASAAFADLRVWLELREEDRRRRALLRDGDAFAPHWERWARQERRAIAREDPRRLADLVVDASRRPQPPSGGGSGDAQYSGPP